MHKRFNKMAAFLLILIMLCVMGVCQTATAGKSVLMMATTTSTDNTGLLDYLSPNFTKETGIELKWTATGTGKALALGKNCDVDVLLVHAPASEKKYVKDGYGVDRTEIMFNDFVIIGPLADPAGIKGLNVKNSLNMVRKKEKLFVSRGDNSGTHKKELLLWKSTDAPIPEREKWYVQTGQGMLSTINIAAERKGYTMTDRGTYIKYEANNGGKPPLVILVEGDDILMNQYSVLAINKKNCSNAQYELASEFRKWMAGENAQKLIKDFKLMGKQLFIPNAK